MQIFRKEKNIKHNRKANAKVFVWPMDAIKVYVIPVSERDMYLSWLFIYQIYDEKDGYSFYM